MIKLVSIALFIILCVALAALPQLSIYCGHATIAPNVTNNAAKIPRTWANNSAFIGTLVNICAGVVRGILARVIVSVEADDGG